MAAPGVARVYGKADEFDLVFTTSDGGTTWTCTVPPDTRDGVYAIQITVVNVDGEETVWTGERYMVKRLDKLYFCQELHSMYFSKHPGGEADMAQTQVRSITFYAGEERLVDSGVSSLDPRETVVLREATYTLTDRRTGEVVDSGDCETEGAKMTVLLRSDIQGVYLLEVTAKVGRETIKQRCGVTFVG